MPEQALFSQNLKAKGKTYYFDVRQAKNGNKYLSISESWTDKDGQKKRSTLTVFSEHLKEFGSILSQMQGKLD